MSRNSPQLVYREHVFERDKLFDVLGDNSSENLLSIYTLKYLRVLNFVDLANPRKCIPAKIFTYNYRGSNYTKSENKMLTTIKNISFIMDFSFTILFHT